MNRILIAEDEKMVRYGIHVMIENSEVPFQEIDECHNGKEAVDYLQKYRYDLVLTDIRMPFMDGIELSAWILQNLEQDNRPFIIAISGYSEFEYAKGMLEAGAISYILKPIDRKEINRALWKAEEIIRERGGDTPAEVNGNEMTYINRKKMQQAVDYIRKNYERPIDMAEVSNQISMNYTMFSSLFKQYTDMNFTAYLRKIRIEKAKKLLRNTDKKLNEVCRSVGFEDASRFTKIFREETGMTPRAYRGKE